MTHSKGHHDNIVESTIYQKGHSSSQSLLLFFLVHTRLFPLVPSINSQSWYSHNSGSFWWQWIQGFIYFIQNHYVILKNIKLEIFSNLIACHHNGSPYDTYHCVLANTLLYVMVPTVISLCFIFAYT